MKMNDAVRTDTNYAHVAAAIGQADGGLTSKQIEQAVDMPRGSVDSSVKRLLDEGYVERSGEGGTDDPYEYHLTSKGDAYVADMQAEASEDAGLFQLFDDEAVKHGAASQDGQERATDGGAQAADADASSQPTQEDRISLSLTPAELDEILLALADPDCADLRMKILREIQSE